jgi:2-polyprenyl-3-methyl-5-hydroxy-6-metoxy-1,4-benzoquinol methylase
MSDDVTAPRSEVRSQYDRWHDEIGNTFGPQLDLEAPWHEMALPYLRAYVPRRDVLEIGCGRGAMARYLAELGARSVTAGDFSDSAIRQTREHLAGLANADASVQDIQQIGFPSASFDTVVSFETIEHVPEPRRAVTELARVLRPGGTLVLTTPNYLGATGLFRIYKRLTGEPFTEIGQPINKLVMLPKTAYWVRHAGLSPSVTTSHGQYLRLPGRLPTRVPYLDRLGWISRMTGQHSLIVAHKDQ